MTHGTVTAEPYPWPYDDVIDPARTALLLIDWQFDFCGEGATSTGWDTTSPSRAPASGRPPGCSPPPAPPGC